MQLTLEKLVSASVSKFPKKSAVVFEKTSYTYAEVEERATRLANALTHMGLRKGDRCAILLYNRAEWLEIYYGLSKVGIIAVPVNFRFTASECEYILNNSEAKVIIYEEAFAKIMEDVRNDVPMLAHYICIGQDANAIGYNNWLSSSSCAEIKTEVKETDTFFLGYTSGTTGFPKGAVVTHRNLMLTLLSFSKELAGVNHNERILLSMPMFHSNSTWFMIMMAINGAATILYPSTGYNPEEILSLIETEKITMTSVVPTMLTMILNLPEKVKNKYDISSLRLIQCASAPITTKTLEESILFFKGVAFYEGYGATELGVVTLLDPLEAREKKKSVGKAVIGKEIRILDDNGNDVPIGEIGELYTRGLGLLLQEYWKNPEATRDAFRGEWLSVGDMARMDEEGYIYLEGRKKDMIISGGENVYPTEVENVVARHDAVEEVVIIGVPDELWGERVHAVIKLKDGHMSTEQEIIDYCVSRLAGYKRPRSIDFVSQIPKNVTGKIVRRKIREPYWANIQI